MPNKLISDREREDEFLRNVRRGTEFPKTPETRKFVNESPNSNNYYSTVNIKVNNKNFSHSNSKN